LLLLTAPALANAAPCARPGRRQALPGSEGLAAISATASRTGINPTAARKVHSLVDKVYQRENLQIAWERAKAVEVRFTFVASTGTPPS
jgi:hypothetical protein